MATHSSILAWTIPWTEEPGRPQSVGSQELDMTSWLHLMEAESILRFLSLAVPYGPNVPLGQRLSLLVVTQKHSTKRNYYLQGHSHGQKQRHHLNFLDGLVVKTLCFQGRAAQVQSLFGKLRSHMPWGMAKTNKQKNTITKSFFFIFFSVLLRYNWHITLCKFQGPNRMIWLTCILKWLSQ